VWVACVLATAACDNGSPLLSSEGPQPPVDSLEPPIDTNSTPQPPPSDTGTPPSPPPSPPPDSTPSPPSGPPVHAGIPFGASVYSKHESSFLLLPPSSLSPAFTALKTDAYLPFLLAGLEAARRANGRVLVNFAGSSGTYTDSNGFNLAKWKEKVDRFRGIDVTSYIADGTLMGHYIMDEPSDARNWNGHRVALADIDEMARYSKEIWPDLPTIIRGWPWYLKGYTYRYLDAAWAAYHVRFGSIEDFVDVNVRDAKASGLALVIGMNVLAGGGEGGLPGYHHDKYSMTASQIRSWGSVLLDEPYSCAFFMFRYNPNYFGRADIEAAVGELGRKAQSRPNKSCLRS
jgi:hypothetical protein